MKVRLNDVAQVIRSKNSGPYELTLDIIFKDWDMFDRFCQAGAINTDLISALYRTPKENVINIVEFRPAKAIKITIVRPLPSGGLGETDVYGAQQHAPLLDLECDV
ncbi:MAG: DUF4387 domain-containing protein [Kiritimatiellia bacterium]